MYLLYLNQLIFIPLGQKSSPNDRCVTKDGQQNNQIHRLQFHHRRLVFANMIVRFGKRVIIKGKKDDKLENKLETARNMLAKGFSNDLIMELTGLTSDEFAKLKPN
jgi:uncharacterized protein (DUF1330 family)